MSNIMKTYNEFNAIIKSIMDSCGWIYDLVIYGSSANGLALSGDSDLDLSLVIHNLP